MIKNLVIFDSRVANYQSLIDDLPENSIYYCLDGARDGIEQLLDIVSQYQGLDSIQIISHGSTGTLYLGSTILNADNLNAYATQLQTISQSLTESGDILLYGCDVAKGAEGQRFIETLAQITGADVAASIDPTGSANQAGDWDLEASTGTIETAGMNSADYQKLLGLTITPISRSHPGTSSGEWGNGNAFAALRSDGSVVTWGSPDEGGDSSSVAAQLDGSIDVTQIFSNWESFAALRSDGSVVTWGDEMSGGDSSSVTTALDGTIDVIQVFSTGYAFAALRADGSVVSWGDADRGGNSISVASMLDGTIDVTKVSSTLGAFAALRSNGSVVTWGYTYEGGDSSAVASMLDGTIDVTQVFSGVRAFAALRSDGSVVTWGSPAEGGDSSSVAAQLDGTIDVTQVFSTSFGAFAALRSDGSVVTWGDSVYGGDSSSVASALDGTIDVTQVFSAYEAFAALRSDGSVVTWGGMGGDSSSVASALDGTIDVTQVFSNGHAFAALRSDGSVVTWGGMGGDSSSVASALDGTIDVTRVFSNGYAFAALRSDGSVVTWGDPGYGGDSSSVASALDGTIDVTRMFSNYYAFAACRADGSVVTWGYDFYGGDSSSVADQLTNVVFMANPYTNDVYTIDNTAINGTPSADVLNGTSGNDVINGLAGNDTLNGLAGNDTLDGGSGNDKLDGGSGGDLMKGGGGSDTYVVDDVSDVVDETPTVDPLLVSTNAAGVQGNDDSSRAQFSSDGRYVLFESGASNLVAGDTNGVADIFIKDLQTGAIRRVSTNAAGTQGNDESYDAQFSSDGRYVIFQSYASNLVAGDTNSDEDIFIKDLQTGAIRRVSTNAAGTQGNDGSKLAQISSDGRYVIFQSYASNLVAGDTNGAGDIFIKDLQTGAIRRVSTDAAGVQGNGFSGYAQISADGRYVVFHSLASNLVADDTNGGFDIFIKDLQTGAIRCVSTDAAGVQGNNWSRDPQISSDDRYVVFQSDASNLVAGDTNGAGDIFIKDLQTGAIRCVSTDATGVQGNYGSGGYAQISADGRYVVFQSDASNLVAGDTNGVADIFIKDLQTGAIRCISTDAAGAQSNSGVSYCAQFSADGRYIVFESLASNLVADDTNGKVDVFRVSNPFIGDAATDTVLSSVSYVLPTAVENLTLTGSAAINGTGNILNNILTGNSANNTLSGGTGNDTLYGNAGNDILNGGTGTDVMFGGSGNDTYYVDNTGDRAYETTTSTGTTDAGGTDLVYSYLTSYTLGSYVENGRIMSTEAANLTGNSLNNTLYGAAGNDTLNGGAGADTMYGGAGNDTYVVANAGDKVTELDGEGIDLVQSSISYTLGEYVENLTLIGVGIINGTGNALNNVITGNAAANILTGNGGADTMYGGNGNDTYIVDSIDDMVIESSALAAGGIDLVKSSVDFTLGNNVEKLTLTGTAVNGTGNALNNVIIGNAANNTLSGGDGNDTLIGLAGNDTLDGGAGKDILQGGTGNDTYIVDLTAAGALQDIVTEAVNAGTDTIQLRGTSSNTIPVTLILGANLENLDAGQTATSKLNLTGNALANTLTGNAADNIINGGAGADTMSGGAGNDTYIVDNAGDIVTEGLDEGTDLVKVAIASAGGTYTLGANVENGTLINTVAYNLIGNALDNVLTGNAYANTLTGGVGNDTLNGLAGNDTLYGSDGADTLNGGIGADSMFGGAGNDTYVVANAGDKVTELDGEGIDLVQSSITYTLGDNIENLTLIGVGIINGTGNALNNVITGNAAANILTGNGGADTMYGGNGNDTYIVDSLDDTVIETNSAAAGGIDLVKSSVDFTLGNNVEKLTLTGTAVNGTGNALNNVIIGNAANNTLSGGDGNDTLIGLAGNDTLDGGAGKDILRGGTGDDTYIIDLTAAGTLQDIVTEAVNAGTDTIQLRGTSSNTIPVTLTLGLTLENLDASQTATSKLNLTGNALANTLTGNAADNIINGGAGADTLIGDAGNDTLIGGAGSDTMTGDSGDDIFRFNTALNSSTNIDTITDFDIIDDIIQLENAIFTKLTTTGGLAADYFKSGSGVVAQDKNDYILYNTDNGGLYYDADGSGSLASVQFATLSGAPAITSDNFKVV